MDPITIPTKGPNIEPNIFIPAIFRVPDFSSVSFSTIAYPVVHIGKVETPHIILKIMNQYFQEDKSLDSNAISRGLLSTRQKRLEFLSDISSSSPGIT